MSNPAPKPIAIIPWENGFKVSVPGEAVRWKTEALATAAKILQVTTPEEQEAAINATAALKGISKGVEDSRVEIKKPYFEAGKAIDAKAKEFVKDIDSQVAVIEKMIGTYQAAERLKAEQARQEEERRRRAAQEELDREQRRVADLQRQQQEAAARAEQAKTAKTRAAAQAEADRLSAEAAQAEVDAMMAQDDAQEALASVPEIEAPKATGSSIRLVTDFEVTDIETFYAWDWDRRDAAKALGRNLPTFVKLEVKKGDFKQFLSLCDQATLDSIPGVKVTQETKASVKAVSPSIALQ